MTKNRTYLFNFYLEKKFIYMLNLNLMNNVELSKCLNLIVRGLYQIASVVSKRGEFRGMLKNHVFILCKKSKQACHIHMGDTRLKLSKWYI